MYLVDGLIFVVVIVGRNRKFRNFSCWSFLLWGRLCCGSFGGWWCRLWGRSRLLLFDCFFNIFFDNMAVIFGVIYLSEVDVCFFSYIVGKRRGFNVFIVIWFVVIWRCRCCGVVGSFFFFWCCSFFVFGIVVIVISVIVVWRGVFDSSFLVFVFFFDYGNDVVDGYRAFFYSDVEEYFIKVVVEFYGCFIGFYFC